MALSVTREALQRAISLTEASQPFPDDSLRVRTYSGRGMNGARCAALQADTFSPLMLTIINLAQVESFDLARELAARWSTDRMGMGFIVYFPGVTLEEEGEEQDDAE